jgi:cobalt/nickel transport system ATP-binding protein
MGEAMVELQRVSYTYPSGQQALFGVTLSVERGEKVALVGPNGAGKSTLLMQLNGILRGEGTVRVAGVELTDRNVRLIRGKVGLVFQDPDDQLFSPTVFDDVAFGPLHMGLPEAEVLARTAWALEQVQMAGFAKRMPHHLSLGEKKRVAIATVLSMRPEILALDEPSAGLDPAARLHLLALLQGLPQTMLVASHDLSFVRELCTRAITLDAGRVVSDRPVARIAECDLALGKNVILSPSP